MSVVISLLVFVILASLVYWAADALALPPPVRRIVHVLLAVFSVLYVLQLIGWADFGLRLR